MITISCNRVRAVLASQDKTLEDLKGTFYFSTDADNQLNRMYHENVMKIAYNDEFIYELAKALGVSCDYILGWTEDKDIWVPSVGGDPYYKYKELLRLIYKYCHEMNIDMYNTNILAYRTSVDREIYDMLFKQDIRCSWWITTSYYIISRMAIAFDFNFRTVISFMLQGEDDDKNGKDYMYHLIDRFNKEFGTNLDPNPGS